MWRGRRRRHSAPATDPRLPTPRRRHRSSVTSGNSSLSSSCHSLPPPYPQAQPQQPSHHHQQQQQQQQWVVMPRTPPSQSWRDREVHQYQQQHPRADGEDETDFWTIDEKSSFPAASSSSVLTSKSTWQEEAHWMSFQNAVLKFTATLKIQTEEPSSTSNDGSFVSASGISSGGIISEEEEEEESTEDEPPVRHIINVPQHQPRQSSASPLLPVDHPLVVNDTSRSSDPMGFQILSHRMEEDIAFTTSESPDDVEHYATTAANAARESANNSTRSRLSSKTGSKGDDNKSAALIQSMASELSETKMRLALAQAERDELEFALLMAGRTESGSTS